MKQSDLYVKGVLTVIAASLLFIAVELGTSSATAQPNQGPTAVVITGVRIMDSNGYVTSTRLPVDAGLLDHTGTVPVYVKYVYQSPLPVQVMNTKAIAVTTKAVEKAESPKQ